MQKLLFYLEILEVYNPKSRISNIDMPISKLDRKYGYEGEPIANTLVHENYSHGTDNLIPQFIQEKYPVIPKDVEMNFNGLTCQSPMV